MLSNEIQKVIWEDFASVYSKEIGKPKRNKPSLDARDLTKLKQYP